MKYIMFHKPFGKMIGIFLIIFPNDLTHSLVAQVMLTSEELSGATVASAGEINLDAESTYGRSGSLHVNAAEEDARLINTIDYISIFDEPI